MERELLAAGQASRRQRDTYSLTGPAGWSNLPCRARRPAVRDHRDTPCRDGMREPGRPDLLDLSALRDRWRIRRDAERLPFIPGRRGSVAAHDLETLCVYVTGRRHVLALLRNLPTGWRRHQIGDDEANVLAPATDLDRACQLVRAYRRRRKSGGRDFVSVHAIAAHSEGARSTIVVEAECAHG